MGRRAIASKDAVYRAAVVLRAEGHVLPLSARDVRHKIGGGSFTTIADLLRSLEAELLDLFGPAQEGKRNVSTARTHQTLANRAQEIAITKDLNSPSQTNPSFEDQALIIQDLQKEVKRLATTIDEKDREIERLKNNLQVLLIEQPAPELEKTQARLDGVGGMLTRDNGEQTVSDPQDCQNESHAEPSPSPDEGEKGPDRKVTKKSRGTKEAKQSGNPDQLSFL